MKNDSLQKWALVAEIVGGVAIVLSLAFVGFQIRQGSEQTELNTRAVEVSAYQDLISQMNNMYLELLGDSEMNDLVFMFMTNELVPDEQQRRQLFIYMGYVFRHAEMAYYQFSRGLISEEQLYSVTVPLRQVLNTEMGYERWRDQPLPRTYTEYMEEQKAAGWPEIL
ncbi:MAG: hypothetical protein JKX72_00035 [Robiginitomaculum sp.]|nr:hypothetical protein [Robiginitomaculum sp.]